MSGDNLPTDTVPDSIMENVYVRTHAHTSEPLPLEGGMGGISNTHTHTHTGSLLYDARGIHASDFRFLLKIRILNKRNPC